MANNKGKDFENNFKADWKATFPGTLIYRLKDLMNGYKDTSQNPCDFICFPGNNKLYMVECKSHKGISISFDSIPQYERLLVYKNLKNVFPGILIWFYEKDIIIWVSIEEAEKMYNDGEKSIGLRMLKSDKYKIVEVPAEKKIVYMRANYSIFDTFEKE